MSTEESEAKNNPQDAPLYIIISEDLNSERLLRETRDFKNQYYDTYLGPAKYCALKE